MSSAPTAISTKIAPNYAEPQPFTIGESLSHLRWSRLLKVSILLVAVAIVDTLLRKGDWLLPAVVGVAIAYLGVGVTYMLAYALFVAHNRRCGSMCPSCASRMWQFCCARCREVTPPLAFLSGRLLLSRCPHCDYNLASKGGLLAWCSTCSFAAPQPGRFYARRTLVVVAAVSCLPSVSDLRAGWQAVGAAWPGRLLVYLPADKHSSSLMIILDIFRDPLDSDPLLAVRPNLLLVPSSASRAAIERLCAAFPRLTPKSSEVLS